MKNLTLSVIALFLLTSGSYAADKKETAAVTVETKTDFSVNSEILPAANYSAIMEENLKLKMQAGELNNRLDDLQDRLNYTQMMHTTISTLQDVRSANALEDAKSQIDFARMMHVTILNLNNLQADHK